MALILGIDPGSRVTGYGLVRVENGVNNGAINKINYVASGAIRTEVTEMPLRLKYLYDGLEQIISQYQPDCVAVEQVFMAKNPDSALKLGHARGALVVCATNFNLPVFEYAARLVKQTLVGTGAADKTQVQHMVMHSLRLTEKPQIDASDALAVAITHIYRNIGSNIINAKISNPNTKFRTSYSRGRFRLTDTEIERLLDKKIAKTNNTNKDNK